jgi:hypothetical protein
MFHKKLRDKLSGMIKFLAASYNAKPTSTYLNDHVRKVGYRISIDQPGLQEHIHSRVR